ncbi:hypothetical protein FRB99_005579 [Tulasnella sp. 403]|nr:hypothetical protein FRB99_005579 [Tulasnella sp. 403]
MSTVATVDVTPSLEAAPVTVVQVWTSAIAVATSTPTAAGSGFYETYPTQGDISPDVALFVGWSFALTLYGLLLLVFGAAMTRLWTLGKLTRPVAYALTVLVILATVEIIVWGVDAYRGFITYRNTPGIHTGDDGTMEYFAFTSATLPLVQDFLYYLSVIIGDSIIIWRLWVVWDGNVWVCTLPTALLGGCATFGAVMLGHEARLISSDSSFQIRHNIRWAVWWFAFVFATNFVTTNLIAGRLKWLNHVVFPAKSSRNFCRRIVEIVIESGAIYTSLLFVQMILISVNKVNSTQLVLYILPMLIAIVPALIVLQFRPENDPTRNSMDFTTFRGNGASSVAATADMTPRHSRGPLDDTAASEDWERRTLPAYDEPDVEVAIHLHAIKEVDIEKASVESKIRSPKSFMDHD